MNYKIISDSSSDIFALSGVNFASVPLKIITDEKQYIDTADLDVCEMIDDLQRYKGQSRSSCPNMEDWTDAIDDSDGFFFVTITKNLSGSYNSASLAADDYISEHPDKRCFVVDTLSAGHECALIVEKLRDLISEGLDFDEIKDAITEYQKSTRLVFCLESLRNLANNGRVSHAAAKVAGILGIRAIGTASAEGTLEMISKVRGSDKAVAEIYAKMKEFGYCGGKVNIHACRNTVSTEQLEGCIRAEFPEASVTVRTTGALCSFYAEEGGYLVGFETAK